MDDDDTDFFAVADVFEVANLAFEFDFTGIRTVRIDAAEYFHQGRFAGPVFADNGVNFTAAYTQIDVVECHYARESLSDPAHFQNSIRHITFSARPGPTL